MVQLNRISCKNPEKFSAGKKRKHDEGGLPIVWAAIRGLCAFLLGVLLVYLYAEDVLLLFAR